MPSLWFCVPVYGRLPLARICLQQLRRTCDSLSQNGVEATAVIVGGRADLDALPDLGFGTVERDNQFVSRKFNDGMQLACERPLPPKPREATHGQYKVFSKRGYRGHGLGNTFEARLDRSAEARAILRGDIELLQMFAPSLEPGSWVLPHGWDPERAADYVVPCGSDDFVDWRIFLDLPPSNTVLGFQHMSFVREDGREMISRYLNYPGGCGIRVYPRQLLAAFGYRPGDEDRKRACDTSILTNIRVGLGDSFRVAHMDTDPRQLVDWKTPGEQLNPYSSLVHHRPEAEAADPFAELAGFYPDEALDEMQAHYQLT